MSFPVALLVRSTVANASVRPCFRTWAVMSTSSPILAAFMYLQNTHTFSQELFCNPSWPPIKSCACLAEMNGNCCWESKLTRQDVWCHCCYHNKTLFEDQKKMAVGIIVDSALSLCLWKYGLVYILLYLLFYFIFFLLDTIYKKTFILHFHIKVILTSWLSNRDN